MLKNHTITWIIVVLTLLYVPSYSQTYLSKKDAQDDLEWLKFSLEYVHPRLYKYQDKDDFDRQFSTAFQSLNENTSALDLLSIVSKINAKVNCGHLYTIPQFELKEEVLNKKVIPFFIKIVNDDLYIFYDTSKENRILDGSKIISINDNPASVILENILSGIATDGYIETRKKRLLERQFFPTLNGFDFYYHLHVDRSETFKVTFLDLNNDQEKISQKEGISIVEKQERVLQDFNHDTEEWFKNPSPTFRVNNTENYGVLALNRSFYNEDIDPNFDSLLLASFRHLKEQKIENLILDLRNNEGGSEHHEIELISFLHEKPYKLYENIYLSHLDYTPLKEIIIERDTADLIFNNDDEYMRKFSDELWVSNYEYSENLKLQPPKDEVFQGQLYVLINGISFSSTGDLAAHLRKSTNAIFIGEESGGTFEGPTGGASIVVQLPNSKIMVRISPNIQDGYNYQKHPFGRGVFPDYEIRYSVTDLLNGIDLEMEKAIDLITSKE